MHGKWQRPASWSAVSSQPATGAASAWKSDKVPLIPQQLQGKSYDGSRAAPLQPSNFVHAMLTSAEHEYLAMETRLWRNLEVMPSMSMTALIKEYLGPIHVGVSAWVQNDLV